MPSKLTLTLTLSVVMIVMAAAQEPLHEVKGIHQAESEYYGKIFDASRQSAVGSQQFKAPTAEETQSRPRSASGRQSAVFSQQFEAPTAEETQSRPRSASGRQSAVFSPQPPENGGEKPAPLISLKSGEETVMVFGWHPYWAGSTAYTYYDYDVLTHIAYFSYEVDTATGGYTTLRGWDTTPIISYAHQRGVKVVLTVTNFGSARNTELLTDTVKQWNLIDNLIQQLQSRNGDGVNFDFESVPSAQKANMVSFCRRAVRGIKGALPSAEISLATPAVNWSDGWDLAALAGICDYLIMMGYNYYWSGSSTAGPVSPISGENYNITRSLNEDYIGDGVPPGKLLLGVPWYGYDWPVTGSDRKAPTTGSGTSRLYNSALNLAASHTVNFDQTTGVPWISYQSSGKWQQMWYDDSLSLQMKNNLAINLNLAGIGIWALSYEAGRDELWNGLKAAITGTTSSDGGTAAPAGSQIITVTPSPVSDMAIIDYTIHHRSRVILQVYGSDGRLVATLADGIMEPGLFREQLNAGNYAPGIYFCLLQTETGRSVCKFAVIKR
ncbi:MAG: glycosyl hydrolase family 18 protein [Bacteroidales bacterium]|jgi:spore germination protein YaaH|nr:glycosyl hydrolase family 18 protein [Bacteroidales bacterium]